MHKPDPNDKPPEVLFLRRYEYTHHSTGKLIANGPMVSWQMVKDPRPGDWRFERGHMVPIPEPTTRLDDPRGATIYNP